MKTLYREFLSEEGSNSISVGVEFGYHLELNGDNGKTYIWFGDDFPEDSLEKLEVIEVALQTIRDRLEGVE